MKIGDVLIEPVSGLKLLVVEPAISGFNPNAGDLVLQGRQFTAEDTVPAGIKQVSAVITCDPGDRSKW